MARAIRAVFTVGDATGLAEFQNGETFQHTGPVDITGTVTADSFVGPLTGNADTASYADTAGSAATATYATTAGAAPASDVSAWAKAATRPTYTASDVGLGSVENTALSTGNAGSATVAATVTVVDSTSATCSVALFDAATGSLAAKTDAGLTYAATTGVLTATKFAGALNGTVGATTANSGAFTTLSASGALTVGTYSVMTGAATQSKWQHTQAASIVMDIDPMPSNGTGAAQVRLFRGTTTSGVRELVIYQGDGSGTIKAKISAATGTLTLASLAGAGERAVYADANGVLSAH